MKNKVVILIGVVAVAGLVYFALQWQSEREQRAQLEARKERLEQETRAKSEALEKLKEKAAELEEMVEDQKEVKPPPPERMAEVFGRPEIDSQPVEKVKPEDIPTRMVSEFDRPAFKPAVLGCETLEKRIKNFFSYLDKKDYPFKEGSQAYFKDMANKLAGRLPIPGEIFEPQDILSNSYHLYRTLNREDIILIKNILSRERDTVEQAMDYFHQHLTHCEDNEKYLPPFNVLYEYAHFFLASMGGRSYLYRLNSDLRTILFYYSSLIVHEADLREANQYGLDIRPHLIRLEDDLKSYRKLYYSTKYLYQVKKIRKGYRPLPKS